MDRIPTEYGVQVSKSLGSCVKSSQENRSSDRVQVSQDHTAFEVITSLKENNVKEISRSFTTRAMVEEVLG